MSFLETKLNSRTSLALVVYGLAVSLLISSTGCAFTGPTGPPDIPPQEPNVVSLDPENWYIFHSAGMPAHPAANPQGVWSFDFPKSENGGYLGYVETPFNATVALHNVTITFEVEDNAAQYVVHDPTDHLPATFRLMIEQQNDDLSNLNGRWWANASMYDLGSQDNQILTISVPLTSDQWTNVDGEHDAQAFSQALANVGWVGLTFGGQYFAGHGVAISSGSAEFILIDYSID
jgi:hypothetical protein